MNGRIIRKWREVEDGVDVGVRGIISDDSG